LFNCLRNEKTQLNDSTIQQFNSLAKKEWFSTSEIIARGSVSEVKYLVLLSKDLNYITKAEYEELKKELDNVGKMINGLINSLRKKQTNEK
jgi:four helix bundle protein